MCDVCRGHGGRSQRGVPALCPCQLKPEHVRQFRALANALSPENLHCDGEISRAAAMRKQNQLRREWKRLEAEVGGTVSEDALWLFVIKHLR